MTAENEVTSVALSSDASLIVSGDLSGKVCAWTTDEGKQVCSMECADAVNDVSLSRDRSREQMRVVSGDESGKVCLWDLASDTDERLLREMVCPAPVMAVHLSKDRSRIASGDGSQCVRLWDGETGELKLTLQHADMVVSVHLSEDTSLVVAADVSGVIRLWDADSGDHGTHALRAGAEVTSARLSDDKKLIVSGDFASRVRLWDAFSGEELTTETHEIECESVVNAVHMSADKSRVVSGDDFGKVRVWDVASTVLAHANEDDGSFYDKKTQAGRESRQRRISDELQLQMANGQVTQVKGTGEVLADKQSGGGCCLIS